MTRLPALLLVAVLALGAAACEAPGAPDNAGGGNNPEEVGDDDRTQTQLDVGEDASADGAEEEDHGEHEEEGDTEG